MRAMLPFSTEFPVTAGRSNAEFVAEVIAWLRGNPNSTVLEEGSEKELESHNAFLIANSGEELRLREISEDNRSIAIGFRHDFPDKNGRIWRTEGVLKRFGAGKHDLVRFRTQCRAGQPGARLGIPKKPYLIKSLIKAGWGAQDGQIEVSDSPIWLQDNEEGLSRAADIASGTLTHWLPILYVSATDMDSWALSQTEIEKLAYDLGGVAHVVVEPSRRFSFRLRDVTAGRNVYAGAVGIFLPGSGMIERLFIGHQIPDSHAMMIALKHTVTTIRERMPTRGWDWSELQEKALINQRLALIDTSNSSDIEDLFNDFVKQLEESQLEIKMLKEQVAKLQADLAECSANKSPDQLRFSLCDEVYPGEIWDRLRYAARMALSQAERIGLDQRSRFVLKLVTETPPSPDLAELRSDINRATKDPKRLASEIITLLQRHGYQEKSDNKHIRLEAKPGFEGLGPITVPKTPSEIRGLKNLRKQIEGKLGLIKL
jgi:hypothetical protein